MTADRERIERRGRTVISARSLQALATRLASETASTRASDVSLALTDDDGRLRASVRLPLIIGVEPEPVAERAEGIRVAVIDGMRRLADRSVSAVDVRFEGVRQVHERRVR